MRLSSGRSQITPKCGKKVYPLKDHKKNQSKLQNNMTYYIKVFGQYKYGQYKFVLSSSSSSSSSFIIIIIIIIIIKRTQIITLNERIRKKKKRF